MKPGAPGPFAAQLKALREAAGFTQEELATIAGISVYSVSALERGERRRPHPDTVRALSAALDLTGATRDALVGSARAPTGGPIEEPSTSGLPLALTPLLGRDADLEVLRAWVDDRAARLITLVGPGGVGKTRLALELAHAIDRQGTWCVVFVPLAEIRDPAFVGPSIADALGVSNVTATDLPARVRAACEARPTLLVLDNCEHVLEAAPLVADVLTSSTSLRLLATSRAPLRVRGEREYVVGPLALDATADSLSQGDATAAPAVRLFVDRVCDVQPDFRLTAANSAIVTTICRRLDALPLALELAAPWLKVLTPEGLCSHLQHDVLLSAAGPRDLPERQQTMSATVGWSYQLLNESEQRAFRRLAVIPARFSIEAAVAVVADKALEDRTNAALGAAAGLIEKSLLMRTESPHSTRLLYHMLETVRAYASVELAAADERDQAIEGLVRYCTDEASRAAAGLIGSAQADWLDRVRDDVENYRAVMTWLIDRGRADEACAIAWRLMFYWLIRGCAAEGLQWYERCQQVSPLAADVQSRALVGAAVMWFTQGEHGRARDAVTRAIALEPIERDVAVMGTHLLGHIEQAQGNLSAARDRFTSSAEEFGNLGVTWGLGNALIGQAGVELATGNLQEGERLLDEATVVLQHAGPWFVNLPLYIRAILAVQQRKADDAIDFVRQSLVGSRQVHDKFAFVYALTPLATAAALKGDDAWAARILGTRDALIERIGTASIDRSVLELRASTERGVRERLGAERWVRAHAAGRTASIDALLADIDRPRGRHAVD